MNNIHELLNTPPVLGVSIVQEVTQRVRQEQNTYILEACTKVGVDPDALILTGQKNAELMEALRETKRQLSEAIHQVEQNKRAVRASLRTMAEAILDEIDAALESNYRALQERLKNADQTDKFTHYTDGKIAALQGMQGFVEECLDLMLAHLEQEGKR